jgi:Fic family protein
MEWFLGCLGRAIDGAQVTLSAVLGKARFWERIKAVQLNDRQRLVINRLLNGFEGKLTTSKYAKLAKCSQDTAHRDILALVDHAVLIQNPEGGRSTSYAALIFLAQGIVNEGRDLRGSGHSLEPGPTSRLRAFPGWLVG